MYKKQRMLEQLFKKYNRYRKEKYFQNPLFETKKNYACLGIGMHSLTNIYPVLRHFNVSVKYVCTKHHDWSAEVKKLFPACIFTNDVAEIINDKTIEAVFICAAADEHYQLLSLLLKAGKKVFVEKPPCLSREELTNLIGISPGGTCKVGLQRRHWEGNRYVQSKTAEMRSYIYQFYFGPYPAGNVVYELFIHALDYCIFIFGHCTILSKTIQRDKGGITIQLHLQHDNGITGLAELSTQHSWINPVEQLSILCKNEKLTINYPLKVSGQLQPKRLLNIPSERIYRQPLTTKDYFSTGNMINPVFDLNTLVLQGFYQELKNFIQMAEGHIPGENDLNTLGPLYNIMDELKMT